MRVSQGGLLVIAMNDDFIALAALRTRRADVHGVLTGRNAHDELCEHADLVTEMKSHKHPFEQGHEARPGIDF